MDARALKRLGVVSIDEARRLLRRTRCAAMGLDVSPSKIGTAVSRAPWHRAHALGTVARAETPTGDDGAGVQRARFVASATDSGMLCGDDSDVMPRQDVTPSDDSDSRRRRRRRAGMEVVDELAALARRWDVGVFAVGWPLLPSGRVGPQCYAVLSFLDELRRGGLAAPAALCDERWTTQTARTTLRALGLGEGPRAGAPGENLEDPVAAASILELLILRRPAEDDDRAGLLSSEEDWLQNGAPSRSPVRSIFSDDADDDELRR